MIAAAFPNVVKDPDALRIFDVFVVKYDAAPGRQSYLRVHRDSSLISITLALNPRADFDGGGMWVEPLDRVFEPDQGHVATFASNIRHGGHRSSRGRRYILVGFLLYAPYVEHDRRLLESSQTLFSLGHPGPAERLCRQSLAVNPRRQEAWNNLGVVHKDAGRLAAAEAAFRATLAVDESYQEGWINLSVCQALVGDVPSAVATARRALALNPLDAAAHRNLAAALDPAALRQLDAALALDPADAAALHARGKLRLARAADSGAAADLAAAAAGLPGSAAVHNDLGVALFEAGRGAEALAALERAAALDPADAQARDNAAAIRAHLGLA